MRAVLLAAAVAATAASPLAAQWLRGGVSEEHREAVPADGVRIVEISAGAGSLRIEGQRGTREVTILATFRAGSREILDDLQLEAVRRGDRIVIRTEDPDYPHRRMDDDDWHAIDLVIRVPDGLALDVEDGSGEVEITGTGAVDIEDGSGSLVLQNIGGDVRVSDGSGEIDARDIRGTLTIVEDGSGEITATNVTGSVVVREDGSGEIVVRQVGGDVTVERKGSGAVRADEVRGEVRVPERHRIGGRARWRRS